MTPEELRADMPATDEAAYLNTGASGPSPRRVVEAVTAFQEYHEYEAPAGEGMYDVGWGAIDEVRETAAAFLSADPTEVTVTGSTGDGINLVAGSIDWGPDDKIVRTGVEHPAGVLPWERRRDVHGVDVEVVGGRNGRFDPDGFKDAVADARLVFLSSISWNHGTRLPVEEVADIAHDAGALVLVDAVQSIGQEPVDVNEWGVDFLAGSAHKWPLGPWGSGLLYVSDDAREHLRPVRIGGHGVEDPYAEEDYAYKGSAAMFEVSTSSAAIYRGMEAALETITGVGLDTVQARIERLTDRLKDGIPDDRLLSPREYESGLVSFDVDDPETFVERVRDDGIVIREIPYPECVRASVHVFNTAEEIDALLEHV